MIQHVRAHDLGLVAVEKAMVSLSRNDYDRSGPGRRRTAEAERNRPDICFFRKEVSDQFSDDQMHFPAPDLVIEISSPSTESIDKHEKFIDYAAHGVKEYWIIDTVTNSIEKYLNDNGTFALQEKLKTGTVKSEVVKGFSFDLAIIFK